MSPTLTPFALHDLPRRPPLPGYKPWPSGDVECRGDPLTQPIIWTGEQWAVTGFGIEKRDGTYPISAEDILDDNPAWPLERQIQTKIWADTAEFRVALAIARDHFGRKQRIA